MVSASFPGGDERSRNGASGGVSSRAWGFVLLACVLSWAPWGAVVLIDGDISDGGWPMALWALGGLGPALAAFVMAAIADGLPGVRRLLRGLARWRVGRWYLLLLAWLPVAVGAVLIAVAVGQADSDLTGLTQWYLLPGLLVSGIVFGGLEEIGWRGYLLPVLQRHRSALVSSVIIGAAWAIWHAPLFLVEGTTQAVASPVWFAVQAVALSVVLAWVYNGTGGSLLLSVLFHGAVNASYGAAVQGLSPEGEGAFLPYAALLTVVVAALLVRTFGPENLSRQARQRW